MSESSPIAELWELAHLAQRAALGGWPDPRSTPPAFVAEIKEDMDLYLRDYGQPWRGSFSPQLVVLASPFPDAASLEYLGKWLLAIHLDLDTDCLLLGGPDSAEVLGPLASLISHGGAKAVLVLGSEAATPLFGERHQVEVLRDRVHDFRGYPVVVTYHPRTVLEDQQLKRPVWKDLQRVQGLLRHG